MRLTRDGGGCPQTFNVTGMVSDNIFTGTSPLGPVRMRVRSNTKRVTDMSIPGMSVRQTSGTFESFTFETSSGCIYAVTMFRQ